MLKLTMNFSFDKYSRRPYYNQDFKLAGIVKIRKRALYMYIINIRINTTCILQCIQYNIVQDEKIGYVVCI